MNFQQQVGHEKRKYSPSLREERIIRSSSGGEDEVGGREGGGLVGLQSEQEEPKRRILNVGMCGKHLGKKRGGISRVRVSDYLSRLIWIELGGQGNCGRQWRKCQKWKIWNQRQKRKEQSEMAIKGLTGDF
ncbi:uncharacterized protein G2W53_029804 [Senna tora]|uniref:Uncharacterized protein n=1 Tax=Senna tora TaxID=362788 RepID=A0A834T6B3_9FABA|nr:uncharacterized protein G2W53_029804 [Senna tora]